MSNIRKNLGTWLSSGLLGFAVVLFAFSAVNTQDVTVHKPMDEKPPAPHSPSAVLEQHPIDGINCWNGEMPKDVDFPGHVIWQHLDGKTVYSKKLVGPALDAIFADGDLTGKPIAFCR